MFVVMPSTRNKIIIIDYYGDESIASRTFTAIGTSLTVHITVDALF